jgi:hypothetical protein
MLLTRRRATRCAASATMTSSDHFCGGRCGSFFACRSNPALVFRLSIARLLTRSQRMQRKRHVELSETGRVDEVASWRRPCSVRKHDIRAGDIPLRARARYAAELAYLNRAAPVAPTMADTRLSGRRRAGRPPAGAKEGEKVRDYPQLSIRLPHELKARLNAMSAVTGLAQWRVIVEAINCFFDELPETDQALIDGISKRSVRAG